ncbi:MAG: glycosyltransferase family 2 protein, partial [Planctomycetota bacterium]
MSSFLLGGLAVAAFLLAALPAVLTLANLKLFTRAPEWNGAGEEHRNGAGVHPAGAVSVLVPARNEAATILRMATAVLASRGVALELVVLDDNSSDATATLVAQLSQADRRVRLVAGKPLAAGWCGKQHACAQLAEEARSNTLVFLDADVLLGPEALARS